MAKHEFCHVEWGSTDLERTKAFLTGLFDDWKFQTWGDGSYYLFMPPGGAGGGIYKVDKVESGISPMVYVEVDAIEPYVERVEKIGGTVKHPKTPIPGAGWFAHLGDPDGNLVGLFQPGRD